MNFLIFISHVIQHILKHIFEPHENLIIFISQMGFYTNNQFEMEGDNQCELGLCNLNTYLKD